MTNEREPQDMRNGEQSEELSAWICYVKSNASYSRLKDGSLCLSIGDEGMETDLVFAQGAMEDDDPILKKQRLLLQAVVRILNTTKRKSELESGEALDTTPCFVPRDLLEALLDNTYELRGERNWWKDEPRCNYQRDYQKYCEEIERVEDILRQNAITKIVEQYRTQWDWE